MERESRLLEYKLDVSNLRDIGKTVVAFANGDGGRIVIGVRDGSREVVGLPPERIEDLMERLPVSLADAIQPAVFPQIYEQTIDDREVLIVQVFPSGRRPFFIGSEGTTKGVYIRVGAHTRRADGEVLQELRLSQARLSYDEAPVPEASVPDLRLDLLPAELRNEKGLLSLGLCRHDAFSGCKIPTRGAVLMLHPAPELLVPEAYIVASRMRGDSGRSTIESQEIRGPIPDQAEGCMSFLESWLASDPVVAGARYVASSSALPLTAVREAVSNALFHRQYSIPGPVKVALYATRLEVFSPGHFAGPFIPESLGDGTSYIRNHVVCRLARRCSLIEKRGTGIRLIRDLMKTAGLPPPAFIEGPGWFKATLPIGPTANADTTEARDRSVMELFAEKAEIGSAEVCQGLGVSRATAVAILNDLITRGAIQRRGRGPSTRYTPTDH